MITRNIKAEESETWLAMRAALWPETDRQQHLREIAMMLSDPGRYAVFVCENRPGSLTGFAEVSLREWAEGCLSSPVGYLEGWFVVPGYRGRGAGRALLSAAENWARSRGCTEMASDTGIENEASVASHLRLGFEEVARVVAFRKEL